VEYQGLFVRQLEDAPGMVLFAAPAVDIAQWAGIPQRRRLIDGDLVTETAGFQREEKTSRVSDIAAFMHDPRNVIQNPLLAAVQNLARVRIDQESGYCTVTIEPPDNVSLSIRDLLNLAVEGLRRRRHDLVGRPVNEDMVLKLKVALATSQTANIATPQSRVEYMDDATETEIESSSDEETTIAASLSLFEEESQVFEFFDNLNARSFVMNELGEDGTLLDSIGGVDREFLMNLVMPVVLVDGQHRLRGALKAIQDFEESDDGMRQLAELIDDGQSPAQARHLLATRVGRTLPVSLLLSDEPAEHVFQFLVVNQKATPISPALLGTIVATSLTDEEIEPIQLRLEGAGINLEGSRAIAFITRSPDSPFQNLVSTGMSGDAGRSLPWPVCGKLIDVVRNLEGGALYHFAMVDFAKMWREGAFSSSGLVEVGLSPAARMKEWSAFNGPWRTFFIKLHTKIRDCLGTRDDPSAHNYWGSVESNLFNKVTLQILTADFFSYLHSQQASLDDWDALDRALDDWLDGLGRDYFARDWRMGGTKRDQPVIKKAWSEAWAEYRITHRLPRVERYNPGGGRANR
jgi:hypothetical protein